MFWFCYWIYFTLLHAANSGGKPEIQYFRNIPFSTIEALCLLIPQVFLAYSMLGFVLPKFLLKNRYLLSFAWFLFFAIATTFLCYVMYVMIAPVLMQSLLPERFIVRNPRSIVQHFFVTVMVSGKGSLVATGAVCSIKLMKHWHLKEKRNLQLLKENAESQLKLLIAQVHPHFLFNTLNNIYSQTQTESSKGSKMIMQLSDLLRYILSEGNKTLVPLNKELQMLADYINLEKVRYGNKLDLHVSVPGNTGNLQITPLLLLPFIENCFKHGASKFLTHPWINLKIELKGTTVFMKLMNGKDTNLKEEPLKLGTGIENARKRLEFLYKDKHELRITDEPEVFVVNLKLELTERESEHETKSAKELMPAIDYA
ncbi:MAG TPA: histidine kinase [Chitinophagaceae bacterium]|nr:histidine kinase [Chitinophagaceae bacterium]